MAARLRELWPDVHDTAYLLLVGDRRPRAFVLGHVRMERVLREAARTGFATQVVVRLALSGRPAARARAGVEPSAPAYVPNDGGVWVAREEIATEVRPRRRPRPRRPRTPVRSARENLAARIAASIDYILEVPAQALRRASEPLRVRKRVPAPAPPLRRVLRRTPHLEVTGLRRGLAAAESFTFAVWCDAVPSAPWEVAIDVEVELREGADRVVVDVWVAASGHFELLSPARSRLALEYGNAVSERLEFAAQVVKDPPSGVGTVTAVFTYEGRTRGRVTAVVPVLSRGGLGELALPPVGGGAPDPPARLKVTQGDVRPGVTLEILKAGYAGQYTVNVLADGVPGFEDPNPQPWAVDARMEELVAGYMKRFAEDGIGEAERRSRLVGAGISLWDVAPQRFKDLYWQVHEAGGTLGSVLVVSQEPAYPWELVVPYRGRGTKRVQHQPLGVATPLGRYIDEDMVAPDQRLELDDSWVLAPNYDNAYFLPHAQEEATFVCDTFGGERIDPSSFDAIEAAFGRRAVPLFHLACHGRLGEGGAQAIALEGAAELMAEQVRAMPTLAAAVGDREPLVFVNACEVGRATPGLLQPGGFATSFISLGARAVIAPLWQVEDTIAHEFAIEFYRRLRRKPPAPPAQVVQALRSRAYNGGADSWAAYSFFGDPNATLV
jgi:hypothetical protein